MSFLIPSAHAQAAGQQPGGGELFQILFLVGLFVLFYFIAIRPQRKRQKEHAEMVAALAKLKSYLDYGTFQPIQIASLIALAAVVVVGTGGGKLDRTRPLTQAQVNSMLSKAEQLRRELWQRLGRRMLTPAVLPEIHRIRGACEFYGQLVRNGKQAIYFGDRVQPGEAERVLRAQPEFAAAVMHPCRAVHRFHGSVG